MENEIKEWLIDYLSEVLELDKKEIDVRKKSFTDFGLDSATIAGMSGDVSDKFEVDIDPSEMYNYSSIEELSKYVFELIRS